MFALMDMSSSSEDEDSSCRIDVCIEKNRLRSSIHVINMSNNEFQMNFRMSKDIFLYILREISPFLRDNYRVTAISKEAKLATTIRFLATGGYQKGIGYKLIAYLSQSKVSDVISECLSAIEQLLCANWIKFNFSPEDETAQKIQFIEKFGIPGVIGCVDGTHIRIKPPKEDALHLHLYYIRKGFYSLKVMLICDCNQVITFVVSRHPGANHDTFMWNSSSADAYLKYSFVNSKSNTWLLAKARNTIERCIGVLKNRFLIGGRGLHYGEEKAKAIINACCALHNICIYFKNEWPPLYESEGINENVNRDLESDVSNSSAAQTIRDSVANNIL